jgi:hypothetical protein
MTEGLPEALLPPFFNPLCFGGFRRPPMHFFRALRTIE